MKLLVFDESSSTPDRVWEDKNMTRITTKNSVYEITKEKEYQFRVVKTKALNPLSNFFQVGQEFWVNNWSAVVNENAWLGTTQTSLVTSIETVEL